MQNRFLKNVKIKNYWKSFGKTSKCKNSNQKSKFKNQGAKNVHQFLEMWQYIAPKGKNFYIT